MKMIKGEDFSQEDIDEAKADYKHVIVAIGFLGCLRCYIDLDYETIVERFKVDFLGEGSNETSDHREYSVILLGFDDTFEIYDLEGS